MYKRKRIMSMRSNKSSGGWLNGFIYLIIIAVILKYKDIILFALLIISIIFVLNCISKIKINRHTGSDIDINITDNADIYNSNDKEFESTVEISRKINNSDKENPQFDIEKFMIECNAQLEHDEEMRQYKAYYNIKD